METVIAHDAGTGKVHGRGASGHIGNDDADDEFRVEGVSPGGGALLSKKVEGFSRKLTLTA